MSSSLIYRWQRREVWFELIPVKAPGREERGVVMGEGKSWRWRWGHHTKPAESVEGTGSSARQAASYMVAYIKGEARGEGLTVIMRDWTVFP